MKAPSQEPAGNSRTAAILVVDDRPDGRQAVSAVLEALGERIVTASSGREALRLSLEEEFAVVLLDVRMPEMDGFETAAFLRSRPKTRHTPIIFVTGLDESSENIGRCYDVGAVDCLFKPFLPEVLRSKVRFFLDLNRKGELLAEANERLTCEIAERERAERERDRAQAELLQGQKLQATGQLAAGIAHEINNPTSYILSNLSTVRGYLLELGQHLRAEAEDPVPASASEGSATATAARPGKLARKELDFLLQDFDSAIADCQRGAERIRNIVRGLREFVHPDEALLRTVDIRQLLENSVELCLNELKYNVTLHRDFGDLPPVTCFPVQIEQVFVNLLVNAAQALEGKKGEIFLRTECEADGVVVSIHDTGPGIPRENLEKLFLPFFTTKPVGKGTGLGLHVAYKIIHAHGGRLEARSEIGKGAVFLVHLPIQAETRAGGGEPRREPG
ncbi:MAG TPA: ATP-binding protein [Planctomycetota bacterium]|nr:ATP-binding protein [Planctomycetota bacterium]